MSEDRALYERAMILSWIRKRSSAYMRTAQALRSDTSQNEPEAKRLDAKVEVLLSLVVDLDSARHRGY